MLPYSLIKLEFLYSEIGQNVLSRMKEEETARRYNFFFHLFGAANRIRIVRLGDDQYFFISLVKQNLISISFSFW